MNTEYSDEIKLHPWIGRDYCETSPRILILGLSMYDDNGFAELHTVQSMIRSIRDEEWNYSFFTKIGNAFSNQNHWYETRNGSGDYVLNKSEFWESVSFYEYLQHIFTHSKEHIDPIYFEEAKQPFLEILQKLKPHIVLVMGYATYNNLPDEGEYHSTFKKGELEMEVWKYNYDENITYACKIQHPSSVDFKSWEWGNLVSDFYAKFQSPNKKMQGTQKAAPLI